MQSFPMRQEYQCYRAKELRQGAKPRKPTVRLLNRFAPRR